MPRPEKVAAVQELAEKIGKSQGVVLTDFRGLPVKVMTELRAELRKAGVELKVVKNTLALLAARQANVEGVESLLEGPTALVFGYEDPVVAAKQISEFAKRNEALKIKGGILNGRAIDPAGVKALADLPPREVLLAQVLRGMQGPISGLVNVLHGTLASLVYALDAIRKQKEQAA